MIEVICDRCGEKLPSAGKIGYIAWSFREGYRGDLAGDNVLEDKHYCQACMDAIMQYINSVPASSGNPAKTAKKRVDAGKVRALADAGRSARWIADDMGISLQSVYNALGKRKEGS